MKLFAPFLAFSLLATSPAFCGEFPEGSPKFKTTLGNALSEGKKDKKPVIAIFSAVWCGPCQTMKHDVYPSAAVKALQDKFVWAYLDADASRNQAPMKKFGVEGIPHIEFLDKDGKSLGKQVGSSSPESFAKTLQDILKKAGS